MSQPLLFAADCKEQYPIHAMYVCNGTMSPLSLTTDIVIELGSPGL